MGVECNRPDGAGLVAEMMLGGVGIFKAAPPGGAFAFHDEILSGGALPLDVLDQRVTAWIAVQKAGRTSPGE